MVYTHLNRIQLGSGDVDVCISMAGTMKEPQALILFKNRDEPTVIGKYDMDADFSQITKGEYNPQKDFVILFSRPESIDCVISALNAAKKVTFGEHNLVDVYLKKANPM